MEGEERGGGLRKEGTKDGMKEDQELRCEGSRRRGEA